MKVTVYPGKIEGNIRVPASKSLTHRAIILAALAEGSSVIENPLVADDTNVTIEACRQFGADIQANDGKFVIRGTGGKLKIPQKEIDCGFSGTSLRFLTAVAALVPGRVILTGGKRLIERPIESLLEALRNLGIKARSEESHVVVEGGTLQGGKISLSSEVSSQFISALLMIAPYAQSEVHIGLTGNVRSRPYINLTLDVMSVFGGQARMGNQGYRVLPQHYHSAHYQVEGDWSAAQYWVAAAAVTGGSATLQGVKIDSRQGDKKISEIAKRMGCKVETHNCHAELAEASLAYASRHSSEIPRQARDDTNRENFRAIRIMGPNRLKRITIDGGDIPDLVPTIAVMVAFADGMSKITNVAHLRDKESDRLAVPVQELAKMGIRAEATDDILVVYGGTPKGAVIDSHNDHRIAMAFAVAGLGAEGETVIEGAEAVSKSYPGFWEDFERIQSPS